MSQRTNPLDHVRVAAPCSADWERMSGDERVRFCAQCSLNVYNLSGMSRREAETLIMSAEGRLCVRFYRRADGTVLTKNCPVGWRALKRRVSRVGNAVFSSVLGFFAGVGLNFALSPHGESFDPSGPQVMGAIAVSVPEALPANVEMGDATAVQGEGFIAGRMSVDNSKGVQPGVNRKYVRNKHLR
ncbi:MAG: hypothetical protein WCD76_16010 [Pyrinomonadaceae bacterium]